MGTQKLSGSGGATTDLMLIATEHGEAETRQGSNLLERCILLVDDDKTFLEAMVTNLEYSGFEAFGLSDGTAARDWLLRGGQCDAIFLGWDLTSISALDFLKQIRAGGIVTPVVVMTAADEQTVEDVALANGAMDTIEKSSCFSVMLKRLRLAMGDTKISKTPNRLHHRSNTVSIDHLDLFSDCWRAHWRDLEVSLTINEYRLVKRLVENPGVNFSYREIYDIVHRGNLYAGASYKALRNNVRSVIKRIREKFLSCDETFDRIENHAGYGYRWKDSADVQTDAIERLVRAGSGQDNRKT